MSDLRVRSGEESRAGLTLCGVVHDEMFFLPAFLAHYRAMGVERFALIDDASTDGTAEFLAAQPDCVTLVSELRYFNPIDGKRALHSWRQALMDRFCAGRWGLFADADEFLALPDGMDLPAIIARLEARGAASVWGAMIDMYPATVAEVTGAPMQPFDLRGPWFFDARPHLRARPGGDRPVGLYRGSRARLLAENGVQTGEGTLRRLATRLGLSRFLKLNNLSKVPLVRWDPGTRFDGSHRILPSPSGPDMLAIMHFKFTADLGRKIAYALETGGYGSGSRQYRLMGALLAAMKAEGRDFTGPRSAWMRVPGDLYRGGAGLLADGGGHAA
jgi:hypothetical protein